MTFDQILAKIDDFVWGVPLIVLILAAGLLLTIRTGFIQVRHLPRALRYLFKEEVNEEEEIVHGEVSGFASLCTALSATIGTGNIVGVGLMGIGTFSQVNGIASAVTGFFDPNKTNTITLFGNDYSIVTVISAFVLAILAGLVIIGGLKRISSVSQVVVPFMAILYVLTVVVLIICNITKLPAAIAEVVTSAFGAKAMAGGALGAVLISMKNGIARGIFSNESGLGSAPIAAAAAKTKEPVRQGLISMTGTFIDTIIICTMTGLAIVMAGSWKDEALQGVQITTDAFQKGLHFLPSQAASFILMICLVFFAFTTILGWNYYGERCLEYLSGKNKTAVMIYRILYIAAVFIGPYMTVSAVWTIADIFNGLMALPNLVALFALNSVVAKDTKDYFKRLKAGELKE